MHMAPSLDRDGLIARIGRLLVADPAVSDGEWHGYALIVRYAEGAIARRLTGFRYDADGAYRAATPDDGRIGPAFDDLREATRLPGREAWDACILRLERASGRLSVDFEYDDPARWDVNPANLADVAARARPGERP